MGCLQSWHKKTLGGSEDGLDDMVRKWLLEIRAEVFNTLNRPQYGNPLADITASASFGRIRSLVNTGPTGSGTLRQIEIAMRLAV